MEPAGLVPKSRRTEAGNGPRPGGPQSLPLGRHSMPLVPYRFFFSFFFSRRLRSVQTSTNASKRPFEDQYRRCLLSERTLCVPAKAVPNGMQHTSVYINAVHFNAACLLWPMPWRVLSRIANCLLSPQWRKILFFVLFCFLFRG